MEKKTFIICTAHNKWVISTFKYDRVPEFYSRQTTKLWGRNQSTSFCRRKNSWASAEKVKIKINPPVAQGIGDPAELLEAEMNSVGKCSSSDRCYIGGLLFYTQL